MINPQEINTNKESSLFVVVISWRYILHAKLKTASDINNIRLLELCIKKSLEFFFPLTN